MGRIAELLHDMWGNLMEAEAKIEEAYTLVDGHKQAADWYKIMAAQHLEFNRMGRTLVGDLIAKAEMSEATTEREHGKLEAYSDELGRLQAKTVRVRLMVEEYK